MPALQSRKISLAIALAAGLGMTAPALAQDEAADDGPSFNRPNEDEPVPSPSVQDAPNDTGTGDRVIEFAADKLTYSDDSDIVEAEGYVLLERDGYRLAADKVVWNRATGRVFASGEVKLVSEDGDIAYGENVELTDTLADGVVENMLIVMADGGRLAARRGIREDGFVTLEDAAYTGCAVETSDGCPKDPSWQVRAEKVYYDPERKRISYDNARIELFGLPVIPLPEFSHTFGGGAESGLLVPGFGYSNSNGVEVSIPYYWRIADNRDLRLTGYVFSDVAPMLGGRYRARVEKGAYQIEAYGTSSRRVDISESDFDRQRDLRGYLSASGELQHDANWSSEASIRLASDRTFADRYDITEDDRLRSTVALQRVDAESFFEVRGWYVQTLRPNDVQDQIPFALPQIDFRYRPREEIMGGNLSFQANTLAVARWDGQDTQRAFASARWDRRTMLPGGQRLTFSLFGRGDLYHSDENFDTIEPLYRGEAGWQTRGIASAAADLEYPLIGTAFGGTQLFTPRVQIVASPKLKNLDIPNEDSRAVDLEDSNLFALNRFPGYDRYEDNVRVTYGFDWKLMRDDFTIDATLGQSYRLSNRSTIFPDGTGLSDRMSDAVGRVEVRWLDNLALTGRFRLDKDNAALRRIEVDATVGGRRTYAKAGYLRLDRNISGLEDLADREEMRLAGRLQISRFWSVYGTAIFDLTNAAEDPLSDADGFEPVKSRVGIAYEDDCLAVSFSWRRDYEDRGDADAGNSFRFRLSFRNLGG